MRNLLSLVAALLPAIAAAARCPFDGPVIRAPKNLRLPVVEAALKNFTVTLNSAVAGELNPGFLTNETSFSILLADSKGTLWEYHHKAPTATKGTKSVNAHSQYRLGSVTKVITDLLMLRLGVDLNDKITKYVPDLAKGKGGIRWDEITLRDLGSHLSGIGRDYGWGENFTAQAAFVAGGFPPIKEEEYPPCGVLGLRPEPCTRKLTVEGLSNEPPVFPVHSKALYSNVAFVLLGYAVENITGLSYEEAVAKHVTKPLGMENTTFKPLSEASMVIPQLPDDLNWWRTDLHGQNPAGGAFSTAHDISLLTQKLLSGGSNFMSDATLRAWLKPLAFTTSLGTAVGFPWEITRTNALTKRDTVDIYAKDGSLPGFNSQLLLLPGYGFGAVVLVAGLGGPAVSTLTEAVLAHAFPAIETAGRHSMQSLGYAGRFSAGNGSWIEIGQDDGPGLVIKAWWSNGVDFVRWVTAAAGAARWALYPAEVLSTDGTAEDWRMVGEPLDVPTGSLPLGSKRVWEDVCYSWGQVDLLQYGGQGVDKVVFRKQRRDGRVVAVEIPFLRVVLTRE